MPAGLKAAKKAKGFRARELAPPKGAIDTGETVNWIDEFTLRPTKRTVWRKRELMQALEPMRDHDGKPIPKMNVHNQPMGGFRTQLVAIKDAADERLQKVEGLIGYEEDGGKVYRVREFILVDLGNSMVEENYAFRPTKAEIQRKQEREARDKAFAALGQLSPAQLDRLAKLVTEPEAEKPKAAKKQPAGAEA